MFAKISFKEFSDSDRIERRPFSLWNSNESTINLNRKLFEQVEIYKYQGNILNTVHSYQEYVSQSYIENLPDGNELTHIPLALHICISELGQHWFR